MRTSERSSSSGRSASSDNPVSEALTLVKTYVKQNTVDELRPAGRFLAFGIPGAILTAIGAVLVLLGVLRLLQGTDGQNFPRGLSWLPYVIVVALCGVGIGVAVGLIRRPTLLGRKRGAR